jgi:hypothetical protein
MSFGCIDLEMTAPVVLWDDLTLPSVVAYRRRRLLIKLQSSRN